MLYNFILFFYYNHTDASSFLINDEIKCESLNFDILHHVDA